MVAFRLSPDMLGHTQFCFSPLAEAGSALTLLDRPDRAGIHRPWLNEVRGVFRHLDLELLRVLVPDGPFLPSFVYQVADGTQPSIEAQLETIERGGIDPVAEEMTQVWSGRPMPGVLRETLCSGEAGLRRITSAIHGFWARALEPHWPVIRSVLEDDVAHRAGRMVAAGMYQVLENIHPEATIDGELLRIDKPHHDDRDLVAGCSKLILVPSVFTFPKLILDRDDAGRVVVIYGARGVGRTWEGMGRRRRGPEGNAQDRLGVLLGRTRATILIRLRVPMTTTELAAQLDQSAGTISEHLACLREAGLLTAWRSGRRVYYRQTDLAGSLVSASGALPPAT